MFSLNFSGNLSDAFFRQKNQVRCFSSVKFYRVFVGGAFCQKQLFLRRKAIKNFLRKKGDICHRQKERKTLIAAKRRK